jgi:hypothetical protein
MPTDRGRTSPRSFFPLFLVPTNSRCLRRFQIRICCCSTPLQALSLLLWRAQTRLASPNPSSSLARVACEAATLGSSPYSAPSVRPPLPDFSGGGMGSDSKRTCSTSSPSSSDSHVRFLRRTFPRAVVSLVFPAHAFLMFSEAEFGLLLGCLLTDSPACFSPYLRIRMSREFWLYCRIDFLSLFVFCPIHHAVETKKQISCSMQLTNRTDDYIAFKVNSVF